MADVAATVISLSLSSCFCSVATATVMADVAAAADSPDDLLVKHHLPYRERGRLLPAYNFSFPYS